MKYEIVETHIADIRHGDTIIESGELVIVDWRDLRVGDVVEYLSGGDEFHIGDECVVTGFDESHEWQKVKVSFPKGRGTGWPTKWRFIRRP